MTSIKHVAVIGAGAAGLTAIKCCLEEGLQATCYEKSAHVGGLWYFDEKQKDGRSENSKDCIDEKPKNNEGNTERSKGNTDTLCFEGNIDMSKDNPGKTMDHHSASVYSSTTSNVSKIFLCYSDFPQSHEWPNFLPHYLVHEYLEKYADHFDLRQHVKLEHEVLQVKPCSENGSTHWEIAVRDLRTGIESVNVFDAVMVCAGLHRNPTIPAFPGLSDFKGEIIHTHAYKDAEPFRGKKVLVVGFGECAVDAAIEISRINKKVYISTRNGNWVIPRASPDGMPYEQKLYSRNINFWRRFSLFDRTDRKMEAICSTRFDHEMYKIKPPWRFTQGQPLISEDLPGRVLGGYIELKAGIKEITANGVTFLDNSELEDVDTIIMGTGYNSTYPFIDDKVPLKTNGKFHLYKWIFPPDVQPSTMAMIGGVRVMGGHFVTFELQARLAVQVFTGARQLPSAATMRKKINKQHEEQQETFVGNPRHHVTLNWLQYNDDLAHMVGCKPSVMSLMLKTPRLAKEVWYRPCVPAQYRLMGPRAWTGAHDVIMGIQSTHSRPFTTRKITSKPIFHKS